MKVKSQTPRKQDLYPRSSWLLQLHSAPWEPIHSSSVNAHSTHVSFSYTENTSGGKGGLTLSSAFYITPVTMSKPDCLFFHPSIISSYHWTQLSKLQREILNFPADSQPRQAEQMCQFSES